jgi:hypothetical protein
MTTSDPLFEFSLRHWPPIYRYKRPEDKQKKFLAAESVVIPADQATSAAPPITNLVEPEIPDHQEQGSRPASSSSQNLPPVPPPMNHYPITLPPHSPAFAPSPFGSIIHPPAGAPFFNAVPQVSHGPATPPPMVGNTYQQFGMMPTYSSNNFSLPGAFPSIQPTPWGFAGPAHNIAPAMSGPLNIGIPGDFPPLHSLPPSFWEPVVQQPQPVPTPPMHTPQAPSLENLASRADGKGENFSDDSLKAIIIKAQPHHSTQTLGHLRRDQLIKHVNDLVIWWKQANPQQATRAQQASINPQEQEQEQQATAQARHAQRLQQSGIPPLSPAVAAAAASAAASAKAAEKVIGQCPCCCEAQQNAAFSPCGHLYACTRCAHRVYDGGRGKCPVCRVQIQTYLKIYATG